MKNNMNDNNLDNNLDKNLDQYFDKARKVQTDFSIDDAAAIIESSNQSAINNVKPNKGVKPMNIIISAAAIVAAGWLATSIDFNSDEADSKKMSDNLPTVQQIAANTQKNDYLAEFASTEIEAKQTATAKAEKTQSTSYNLATMAQLPTKKDEDPINHQEFTAKANSKKYALTTESKSKSKQEKVEALKQDFERNLNITGINPISLTNEEFRSLGVQLSGDTSLTFETNSANINLTISNEAVYSQEWKIKNEPDNEEYLTPQLITADGKDIIYSISISNKVSDMIPNNNNLKLHGSINGKSIIGDISKLAEHSDDEEATIHHIFTTPIIEHSTDTITNVVFGITDPDSATKSEVVNNESHSESIARAEPDTFRTITNTNIYDATHEVEIAESDEDVHEVDITIKEEPSTTNPIENISRVTFTAKKIPYDNEGKSEPRMVKYTEIRTEYDSTAKQTELGAIIEKMQEHAKSINTQGHQLLDSINKISKYNLDIQRRVDSMNILVDEMTSNIEWTFIQNVVKNISETVTNAYDEAAETAKINKLIPFKTTMKGKDLIIWYAVSEELIDRVPERVREKIKSEIKVLSQAEDFCDAYPGSDAHFDIWRSCGGMIENLTVYPNPATTVANAVIDLKEAADVRFSLHSLDGNELYSLRASQPMAKGKHEVTLPLDKVSSGFYLLVASTAGGDTALQRLIVKQ